MDGLRIPIGTWADGALDWAKDNLSVVFDITETVFEWSVVSLTDLLTTIPPLALIVVLGLIGWYFRSWQIAVGTVISFALIIGMDQWEASIQTLSLVTVSALIAIVIAVPLGILMAQSDRASAVLRPILDFMQTMPAFVYLIPAITFFSIGVVPGVVATIIFSLPPGVRFTELGIRGVDQEKVEAGQAFGATPGMILRGIQLPLAAPTIMAGINQVIMLALSMAVIAGFAGADGLGKEVVAAISTLNVPRGVEAGLSVVVLAIFLDRVTSALGAPAEHRNSIRFILRSRRTASAAS